ncbi:ABC transporter substrate-binding protein, partial [Candidatus Woesearchaeota archaeon]|nr:ABC transporter substrate-binding protein [Candidatus Woesearchaeota archaeon]
LLGSVYGTNMAEFGYSKLNARTASVLYINQDNGIGYKQGFIEKFEELGGRIVSEESYEPGTTDFRTHLSKIKEKNPDVFFLAGQEAELAVKQTRELGIKAQILGPTTLETSDMVRIAENAAEGIIYTTPTFDPEDKSERVQEYLRKYKEKYGDISEYRAANAYDAVYIIALMIEKCGSERNTECIRDELYKVENYPGVSGNITFDENGDVIKPTMIKTIRNGQFVKYE